jgi:hypothetical protein
LRRSFARFNLRAHLLQARGKRFNLLLLPIQTLPSPVVLKAALLFNTTGDENTAVVSFPTLLETRALTPSAVFRTPVEWTQARTSTARRTDSFAPRVPKINQTGEVTNRLTVPGKLIW